RDRGAHSARGPAPGWFARQVAPGAPVGDGCDDDAERRTGERDHDDSRGADPATFVDARVRAARRRLLPRLVVSAVAIALALGATLLPYPGPAPSLAAARSVDPAPTAPTAPAAAPNPDGPRPDRPNARHATDQVVLAFSRSLTKAEA